jgi:hypothetical protein
MAYRQLRENGLMASFLKANVDCEGGQCTITDG